MVQAGNETADGSRWQSKTLARGAWRAQNEARMSFVVPRDDDDDVRRLLKTF